MWEEIASFRDCVEEARNSSFLFLIFWMSLSCLLSRGAFISAWDFKSTCNRKQAWEPLLRTPCVLTSGRLFSTAHVFQRVFGQQWLFALAQASPTKVEKSELLDLTQKYQIQLRYISHSGIWSFEGKASHSEGVIFGQNQTCVNYWFILHCKCY